MPRDLDSTSSKDPDPSAVQFFTTSGRLRTSILVAINGHDPKLKSGKVHMDARKSNFKFISTEENRNK